MIEPLEPLALVRTVLAFALPIAGLAWTAWAAGRTLLAALGLEVEDELERVALASILGLAVLAHALLALGLLAMLRPWPVVALVALVHGVAIRKGVPLAFTRPGFRRAAVGVVVALPFLVPALYPDTGFDSRMYHLPYVHAFARTGRLSFLPDLRFPIFPQASEVLSTALVLSGSEPSASGTGLLAVALAAALLVAWGRRAFPSWPAAGLVAAAIFLGSPLIGYLATVLYVDPLLGLFSTAALLAAERFRAGRDRRWLVLAAALAASAADVKYLGLYTVAVTGLALATRRPRHLALYALVALAVLAPWYGRIVAATGNPVFPFLPSVFGENAWTPVPELPATLAARLVNAVRMPFDLAFARERWNRMPPLSPVFALAVPLVVLASFRSRRIAGWAAVIGVFVGIYQWLPKSAAYTAMGLPLASLTVAGSIATLGDARLAGRSRGALVAAALCLAPGWLYGLYTAARNGSLPVTAAARERYLDSKLPLHAAVRWLNDRHGADYTVWAVNAEHMTDFARGRFLGDSNGRAELRERVERIRTFAEQREYLLGLGADHLLVPAGAEAAGPGGAAPTPPLYRDRHAAIYELRG
jgi:hypothetical protein